MEEIAIVGSQTLLEKVYEWISSRNLQTTMWFDPAKPLQERDVVAVMQAAIRNNW